MSAASPAVNTRSSPAGTLNVTRAFEIPLFSEIRLNERRLFVQQRLGDQWVFVDRKNERPTLLYDDEIGRLMSSGDLIVERIAAANLSTSGPRSPLLTSERDHASNLRKHAYVDACRKMGEHFRRSKGRLTPIIAEIASVRGEKAPGFTTVLSWLDEAEQFGDQFGTAAYSDQHYRKGRRGPRLPYWQEDAIQRGVEAWLSVSRMTKCTAYAKVCEAIREFDATSSLDKAAVPDEFLSQTRSLKPPSKRTFERRCAEVDRYTREYYKRGRFFADNNNRTFAAQSRPLRPYEDVEVDHCTLDVVIVDESGCLFGRPDLVVFRDRATAMICGFSIGFEAPSYASFLEGLRHATYPKPAESLPGVRNPWPCYGRIENLWVDNALHLIGNNIAEAGRELNINIERLPRRSPWMKGSLERFFQSMGVGLIHMLPGTTLEHVVARRDHENLGSATLTLAELRGLVSAWICDDYHQRPTKGLGIIRGHGDIPSRVWSDLAEKCPASLPPNRDLFTALAGDVDYRTIQRDGIAWDCIKYESPALTAILTDPHHGVRREGRTSTKYKVVRDPYHLGEISVINHHTGEPIRVAATVAHQEYAQSVTLHQHRVILARANEKVRGAVDIGALMRVRSELADLVIRLLNKRPKTLQKKLARYQQKEWEYRLASRVVTVPTADASDFIGTDLPFVVSPQPLPAPVPSAPPSSFGHSSTVAFSPGAKRSRAAPAKRQPLAGKENNPARKASNQGDCEATPSGEPTGGVDDLQEFKKKKAWSVRDGRSI